MLSLKKEEYTNINCKYDLYLFVKFLKETSIIQRPDNITIMNELDEISHRDKEKLQEKYETLVEFYTNTSITDINVKFKRYKNDLTIINDIIYKDDNFDKIRAQNIIYHLLKNNLLERKRTSSHVTRRNRSIKESLTSTLNKIINRSSLNFKEISESLRENLLNTIKNKKLDELINKNQGLNDEIITHLDSFLSENKISKPYYEYINNIGEITSYYKSMLILDILYMRDDDIYFEHVMSSFKKSWSTKKHRLKQGTKKPFTTTLLPETKDKLDYIVTRGTQSISDTLTRIINEEHERLLRKR